MFFFVLILEFVDQNEQKKTTSELFLFQIGLFRSNSRLLHHQNQRLFKLINGLIYGLRSSVSETSSLCYVCRIKCRDVMTQYMLQYMNCRSKYYNKKGVAVCSLKKTNRLKYKKSSTRKSAPTVRCNSIFATSRNSHTINKYPCRSTMLAQC